MRLRSTGRSWSVLNYAVTEPNKWTCRAIAEDLDDSPKKIGMTVRYLQQRGFVVKGEKLGKAHTLLPTPLGVEVLYEAI